MGSSHRSPAACSAPKPRLALGLCHVPRTALVPDDGTAARQFTSRAGPHVAPADTARAPRGSPAAGLPAHHDTRPARNLP
ncbi:hypothetical protein, partial [Streptomyces scabiei]|uniref:hypothetical protein n=1 Tax=Streptomyces scabiei TaxID=1930 RepID=UPI001F3AEDCF